MTQLVPMITSRAAASFVQIQISGVAQAAAATAIVDPATDDRGTDASGWIDVRSYSLIHATAKAAGTNATITAQVKSTADSDPIALTLTDGALTAGTAKIVLDDVIKAGFIRFLCAGTVGGSNTVALHVVLK